MARDASEVLGAPEVAGTFVSPKGLTMRLTGVAAGAAVGRAVGGNLGRIAGGMAAAGAAVGPYEGAPQFGTTGYLAVSAEEIAIIRAKMGLFKPKVGSEVAGRIARSEVSWAELTPGGLKAALRIGFSKGGSWEFEIPRIYRRTAEQVVRALGGRIG